MSAAIKKPTLLFIVMLIFILLAKTFLGEDNVTVGVVVVLMSFMLLGKDLTGNLLKNSIKLICLIIFICFCTYIASFNIYLGLFVNFIGVFVTTYASMSDLKSFVYQPFLLAYVLMLTNVPHHKEVPLRFIGFILGGLFAMLLQYLVNGKKGSKVAKGSLENIVDLLKEEIKAVRSDQEIDQHKDGIREEIKKWNSSILERRESYFNFTKIEELQLNIISTLENFELSIEDLGKHNTENNKYDDVLKDLDNFFDTLKKSMKKDIKPNEFIDGFKSFYNKYEKVSENDYLLFELFKTLERLDYYIADSIMAYKNEEYRESILEVEKPSLWFMIKSSISKSSLRFTFSLRLAIMISVVYFVAELVHFEYAEWIIITIAMASVPYRDHMKIKGLNRIYGTLIGGAIFFILFTLIDQEIIKILIILIAFYVMNMTKNETIKNSCSTILVLGIFGIASTNTLELVANRAFSAVIGVVIGGICSIIILPYDIEKETKVLINRYNKAVKDSILRLEDLNNLSENRIIIKNTLNISRAMEHKILVNNRALNDENIDKFVQEQRNIINNLYVLISNMDDLKSKEGLTAESFKKYIEKFHTNLEEEHEKLVERIKNQSLSGLSMNDKFRYYNICKLFSDENDLDNFIKEKNLI